MKARNTLAMVPLALALGHAAIKSPSILPALKPAPAVARKATPPKEFSVPLSSLRDWAKTVVVTMQNVKIEGNSAVHALEDDCEIHFGAHTPDFSGAPDGLVMEPMNACVEDPPSPATSWTAFAKSLKNTTVTAAGVPRIWPEHLVGGSDSNPDHAVELHPLASMVSAGNTFDFSANIFAGDYRGKDGNRPIVTRVNVSVVSSGDSVEISFQGGQIGNFTTMDLEIDRASIASDGDGSFRMNGTAVVDSTRVPVRIVTVKGSPMNHSIANMKRRTGDTQTLDGALVLYSLSPEALVDAADKSNGNSVKVDRPIQLILYGVPESG